MLSKSPATWLTQGQFSYNITHVGGDDATPQTHHCIRGIKITSKVGGATHLGQGTL